jgi:glycosyltransferase involved in cell wall biosynthesis
MNEPLFSVIVPTHDRPHMLAEAVASVLNQTVEDLECIVVDDSGRGEVDLSPDPRIRVVRGGPPRGAAGARNLGLSKAGGRYVTFLDDDDLLTPDRLEIALEGLSACGIALCWRTSVSGGDVEAAWNEVLEGDIGERILHGPIPHVGQVALELRTTPAFDERFRVSEDVEWWLRTALAGRVTTVRRVGYLLRHHGEARQTDRLEERLSHRLLLLRLHSDYFSGNKEAASYQWRRVGGFARALGDRRLERKAFRKSLSLHPEWRSLARLGLSYLPHTGET